MRTSTARIPTPLAPATSASTSSPTIQVISGSASSASSAAEKYDGLGLPSSVACTPGGVLEPGDERAGVEQRPARRLPPAVAVQAVELGACVELRERAGKVHVAEDAVRLGRLVRAAEEHRLGLLADELHALEVLEDRGHRHREHAASP